MLAGFMGTGKSTVGQIVAGRLDWPFVDTDAEIETRAGCAIAAIFAQQGEAAFRQLEADVCAGLAGRRACVIATGGGALLNAATRAAFEQRGLVIGLTCALDEIVRRIGHDPRRPLFTADRARLAGLLAERVAHYASLPHVLDTTDRTPDQVAEEVIRLWQAQ